MDLDAGGSSVVETGIGFLDHMLDQLASHGGFRLELSCRGDLEIDEHHTVEDCALALGQALDQALGERRGIGRYGFLLPMDESLAQVAIDLSGRPAFVFEADFPRDRVGELSTEMVQHFFASLSQSLGAALHLKVEGGNTHHMIEALFKGDWTCPEARSGPPGNGPSQHQGYALMSITVVNSGGANISSVLHALHRLGAEPRFTADPELISSGRSRHSSGGRSRRQSNGCSSVAWFDRGHQESSPAGARHMPGYAITV